MTVKGTGIKGRCDALGVAKWQTVYTRMRKGETFEQAILPRSKSMRQLCLEASIKSGVDAQTIRSRVLKKGETFERASEPTASRRARTIKGRAKELGIPYSRIHSRTWGKGMTFEEAAAWVRPLADTIGARSSQKMRALKVTLLAELRMMGVAIPKGTPEFQRDMAYNAAMKMLGTPSLTDKQAFNSLCQSHGLGSATVRKRMKKGLTLEQALNTPKYDPAVLGYRLQKSRGLRKRWEESGSSVPFHRVYGRVYRGIPVEEALTVQDRRSTAGRAVANYDYSHTLAHRLRLSRSKIPYDIVKNRVRNGWSEERAFSTPEKEYRKCATCGTAFEAPVPIRAKMWKGQQKFCSEKCNMLSRRDPPLHKKCAECGKKFVVTGSGSVSRNVCSDKCRESRLLRKRKARSAPHECNCITCGTLFLPPNMRHKFCSPKCKHDRTRKNERDRRARERKARG